MTKKRFISLAALLVVGLVIATGWSALRGKMYPLSISESEKLEYETPTMVPFKEMGVVDVRVEKGKQFTSLMNADKDMLDIQVTKVKPASADVKVERVKLEGGLQGEFIPDDSGKRKLAWLKDGIYYELIYYAKLTPKEVSKAQLVEMAESFK